MPEDTKRVANYIPTFFETEDPQRARELILTKNHSMSSEERWEKETPYLCDKLTTALAPTAESVLLDFGCGIGRLAKALIERHACRIVGVDISASMRRMAEEYVASERFRVIAPETLDHECNPVPCADHAYAVWVLQHTAHPHEEIRRIHRALKPGGKLYLVNAPGRCVPCDLGWVNDGIDIYSTVTELGFRQLHREKMALYPDDNDPNRMHWCVTYQRL
jgi:cyclopropane fatty-acyl-phospholipid synthase-like methyltransferase